MFNTIVHQTLQNKENADEVERDGPYPVEDYKNAYLGYGYYFWDDHFEIAQWWGMVHCSDNYFICEGELNVDFDSFFDLVGSRKNQKFIREAANDLGLSDSPLGKLIEILKDLEKRPDYKGIFPYKVIRAVDETLGSYNQDFIKFVEGKKGKTSLSPQIIICLIEKNARFLRSYKVIYPENYRLG